MNDKRLIKCRNPWVNTLQKKKKKLQNIKKHKVLSILNISLFLNFYFFLERVLANGRAITLTIRRCGLRESPKLFRSKKQTTVKIYIYLRNRNMFSDF